MNTVLSQVFSRLDGNYKHKCQCPEGFAGDECEDEPCKNNPCKNGGKYH